MHFFNFGKSTSLTIVAVSEGRVQPPMVVHLCLFFGVHLLHACAMVATYTDCLNEKAAMCIGVEIWQA